MAGRSPRLTITLPRDALVLLIGPSGSGKTTFARRHFRETQILSSDGMRALVADDANDQTATDAAFELLHALLALRLARGRLSVVDATNVEAWAREQLLAIARRYRRPAVAIVLAVPLETILERNLVRSDRQVPPAAIRRQHQWLRESLPALEHEAFDSVVVLDDVRSVDRARVEIAS
ncbi:MAG TPA: AAA family ATPase [candidate division Zixibacteria bacterium]|nr:AAA family ATPase [candidate division Zixibacteria bacterium]